MSCVPVRFISAEVFLAATVSPLIMMLARSAPSALSTLISSFAGVFDPDLTVISDTPFEKFTFLAIT